MSTFIAKKKKETIFRIVLNTVHCTSRIYACHPLRNAYSTINMYNTRWRSVWTRVKLQNTCGKKRNSRKKNEMELGENRDSGGRETREIWKAGRVVRMKCNPVAADRKIGIVCTVRAPSSDFQTRTKLLSRARPALSGFCATTRATGRCCPYCRTCKLVENTPRNRRKEIFSKIPSFDNVWPHNRGSGWHGTRVRAPRPFPVPT